MKLRQRSFAHGRARACQTAVALAAAALCLAAAGCGGSGGHTVTAATSSPSPTPVSVDASPVPSASDKAKAQLLAAYQGFWKVQEEAYSSGSLEGVPVNTYALGQAFYDIKSTLAYYNSEHLVMRGKPVLSPKVTALSLASPHTATITDCIDTSNFLPVNKDTGKPAKLTDDVFRHPWTFTASYDNVQWRIVTGKLDRTRTC